MVDNDTVRRRRRREDDEGESLDDILDSVPRKEADEDEFDSDLEDETVDSGGHSRVPSGMKCVFRRVLACHGVIWRVLACSFQFSILLMSKATLRV